MIPTPRDNSYDKIFKENIESLIFPLALKVLGLPEPEGIVEIPDDLQYTIERKPDFLKLITDKAGQGLYVLHLECQTTDEPEMLARMLIYRSLLYNRHQLPVKQYVLFLGPKSAKMPHSLEQDDLSYRFHVRSIIEVPYQAFLESDTPEEVVFTILGNLSGETPKMVLRKMLNTLRSLITEPLKLEKFMRQLEVLSNLRNLQKETIELISEMPLRYDLETDIRYLQGKAKGAEEALLQGLSRGMQEGRQEGRREGRQEGRQEAKREDVKGLLRLGLLTVNQIAQALQVSEEFVRIIQAELRMTPPSPPTE